MTYKVRTSNKRLKTITSLEIKRPQTNAKTDKFLEKKLKQCKIVFNKRNNTLSLKNIINMVERLAFIRKAVTYTCAILIMGVLLVGSVSAVDLRFANEAIVNGYPVGIVQNTEVFEKLISDVESSLGNLLGNEVDKIKKPVYITRLVFKKDLTPEYRLRQNLLSTYDEVSSAYAVYVGDKLICAALDENTVNNALEKIKAQYKTDNVEMSIEFNEPVAIKKEFVPIGYIRSADGVFSALTAPLEQAQEYKVEPKDTLWGIASNFNMSVDDLMSINQGLAETIHDGDIIKITKSVPLLPVKITYMSDTEQPIPYENEEIKDSGLNDGHVEVLKEGSEGKKRVVEQIVKINNEIVDRIVKTEEILVNPIGGQIKIGTKPVPKNTVGSGQFLRPAYGIITSRFGRRGSGQHTGIDYANPIGTPIKVSDTGTVTFAGWKGGYGKLVIVSHGNGTETYYAHCSSLLVSNGQKVNKGEVIAKVGNTGNSTGPHLHFEIRKNGVPQNPASYVK